MFSFTVDGIKNILLWGPIPFVIFIYMLHHLFFKSKWRAIHFVSEYTTVFFMLATAILVKELLQVSIIGYLFIAFCIVLAIILIKQRKSGTEISFNKAMKLLMRISFLLFSIIYLGLLIAYILLYVK